MEASAVNFISFFVAFLVAHLLEDGTEISCCGNPAADPSPSHHMLWPHHPLHQTYS